MNIGQLYRVVPKIPTSAISNNGATGGFSGKGIEITVLPSTNSGNRNSTSNTNNNVNNNKNRSTTDSGSKTNVPTGPQQSKVVHLTPATKQQQHQRNKQPAAIIEENTSDVYSSDQNSQSRSRSSSGSSVVRSKTSKHPNHNQNNDSVKNTGASKVNNGAVEHYTFSDLSSHIIDRTIGNITGKRQGKKRRDEPPSLTGCVVDILDEKCIHIMSSLLVTEVVQKFQHYVQQSEKALLDSWNNTTTNHRDKMISNNEQAIPASHRVIVDGSAR